MFYINSTYQHGNYSSIQTKVTRSSLAEYPIVLVGKRTNAINKDVAKKEALYQLSITLEGIVVKVLWVLDVERSTPAALKAIIHT
jgi:hypothetical protein